jgi:hypothetical protein
MMYFISSNSGYFAFGTNINYYYISEILKRPPSDYALFLSYAGLAWSIKPIYGWISDSIYPLKYRFKPYIFLCCLVHILTSIFVMVVRPEFDLFCYCFLLTNVCVAFIDTMAEGITAINTKLQAKIVKL